MIKTSSATGHMHASISATEKGLNSHMCRSRQQSP